MRCNECSDKLPEYSLGVLTAADAEAMADHLTVCPECRAELAAFERLDEAMAPAARTAPERDLWPGVAYRIKPRRVPVLDWLVPRWQPALAAAAVLLVLVVGGLLYSAQPPAISSGGETLAAGYQEQQIIAEWSQPLADDAALGLMLASLETGEGDSR